MYVITIGNIYSKISGDNNLPSQVTFALEKGLSYTMKDAFFITREINKKAEEKAEKEGKTIKKVWDGVVKLFWDKGGECSFYTGMASEVLKILKSYNIRYSIIDARNKPLQNCHNLVLTPIEDEEVRPYQDWTVDIAYKATRGIIEAATGSGKTWIITKLIHKISTTPFLFLVLSTDLLDQAYDTLSSCLNIPIGKIGDGIADIKGINVMTVQTAVRAVNLGNEKFKIKEFQYDENDNWDDDTIEKTKKGLEIQNLIKNCKGVYFDEMHHISSKSCKEVMRFAKQAYWRYGGSATPYREDGQEMMMQALLGKKLVDISASYLIQHNFLVKPHILDVHMQKNTNVKEFKTYANVYSQNIVHNEILNKLVIDTANFFEQKGITTLILVQQYPHGENLKLLRPDLVFIKGNQPKKQRKQAIQDLRDGKIKVAIATTLADEGLDIKRLGAVIVAGGGKSITRVYQRVGRTLRKFPGKTKAFVVLFRHNCKYLDKHGRRVFSLLKKEKEFDIQTSNAENLFKDIEKKL